MCDVILVSDEDFTDVTLASEDSDDDNDNHVDLDNNVDLADLVDLVDHVDHELIFRPQKQAWF